MGAAAASIGTDLPPFFALAGLAGCLLNRRLAISLHSRLLSSPRRPSSE
jgi:hypothetical protein